MLSVLAATFLPKHRFIVKSWDMETACKKLSVAVRGFGPGSSTAISSTAVFVYFRFVYSCFALFGFQLRLD